MFSSGWHQANAMPLQMLISISIQSVFLARGKEEVAYSYMACNVNTQAKTGTHQIPHQDYHI